MRYYLSHEPAKHADLSAPLAERRPTGISRLLVALAMIATFVAVIEYAVREVPAGGTIVAISVNPGASR